MFMPTKPLSGPFQLVLSPGKMKGCFFWPFANPTLWEEARKAQEEAVAKDYEAG